MKNAEAYLDFSGIKTYSALERTNLVKIEDLKRLVQAYGDGLITEQG